MKKSILFLAGTALLFAGCAKVEDEAPIPENGKRVVTLKATVNEADTRVSVESDGTYQWQSGDEIGVWVVDSYGGKPYPYTTQDSGTTANFEVSLDAGEDIGEYAFYPFSEDHFVSGEGPQFALDANLQYVEDATNMPMLGTVSNGAISFKSVGGVIKLTVNNIPSDAARLLFSAKDLNGDDLFISGVFPVSGDQINAGGIMGVNSVNIDFTGKWQSSMVFYVPLPTGTYGGFEIEFDNANSSKTLASKKVNFGSTGLTIERNQIIVAPALDAAPDYSGEWIMVGEHNNSFFACPAYSGGNNIDGVEVSISENVVTSDDNTIKMTFTKVTTGDYKGLYTIQDNNGWYLYAASASKNYLKANLSIDNNSANDYYWSISADDNGGFSIVASQSDNHNILRFNTSSALFSCYVISNQGNIEGSNVQLYKWDNAVFVTPTCATPAISCINNLITITCSTTDATIYYEIGTTESTTSDPTTASAVYDPSNKPSITADSYVKAIAVADGHNNSAVAGASVTYTEPSSDVWTLVTDASTLAAGDVIVFACNSKGAVAGSYNSGYLNSVTSNVSFSSNYGELDYLPADALQFILGGSTDEWTFTCDNGQLFSKSTNLNFNNDGDGKWKISIDSNNNAIIENCTSGNGKLLYNSSNPRFKTYTSNQTAIQLYRKQTATPLNDWSLVNTSNVTFGTSNSYISTPCDIVINNNTFSGAKAGTSNDGGFVRITVPQGTKVLHLHLASWSGKTVTVSIKRTTAGTSVGGALTLKSDSGISGNSPFTLQETDVSLFHHAVTLSSSETGLSDDLSLDISSSASSGEKRFVIWGVNYE